MEDVAREAGVSRALVSLVMRDSDKVSPERRERVRGGRARGSATGPNAIARNLASRAVGTVGFLLNDLHNPFFAEIAAGIEDDASDLGHRLLFITGGRRQRRELAMLEALLEYRTDGLILVSPRMPAAQLAACVGHASRACLIGRRLRSARLDYVVNDESRGAHLAIEHLAGLGHARHRPRRRRPGAGAAPRRAGYLRAMAEAGLSGAVIAGGLHRGGGGEGGPSGCCAATRCRPRCSPPTISSRSGLIDRLEQDGAADPRGRVRRRLRQHVHRRRSTTSS